MRWLFLVLLFSCSLVRSQSSTGVTAFFVDPVGKAYLLLTDGSLVTENPLGQNAFAFFDSSLGTPDIVDVTNPFAVVLFYADYGTAIILDRTLSEVRRLDLFRSDRLEQPTLLARATDNGLWVFDAWDYRLKQLDQNAEVATESNDLRLQIGLTNSPAALYVYQNQVLLLFPEQSRLATFTNFGQFRGWVELPPAAHYGWLDGRLGGWDTSDSWVYDLRNQKFSTLPVPVSGPLDLRLPTNGGALWYDQIGKRTVVLKN